MGIVAVVQFVAGVLRSRIMFHVGQRIDATLITDYCAHLFRLPQAFFDQMRVGELTSRVSDATRIRAFFSDALVEAITNTLIVIGASAVLLWRDWRLAATALALLPAASLLYVASTRLNRRVQREVMEKAAALESDLVESIGAIGTIKRHGIEATRIRKTNARLADLLSSVDRSTRGAIWISTSGQLMAQLGAIALLGVGATRVTDAGISLGELMSSYALFGFLAGPLLMLVGVSRSIQEMRTAASRLFDIMDMEPEPDRALDRKSSKSSRHDDSTLHFDNVTFRYNGRRAAIDGFSLQCAPGTLTALVGESGSGKSTIAALAQRLYPAESGRITIGDRDITTLDVVELRRLVGIVPQNIDIFAATILENIALFADDPDMDTVLNVCERTGLSEALQHWPLGMMTMIGERGATLSGGERQRLAIARALYRDPAILVLDEVTSALDSLNEARIVSLMQELAAAGTTVIVIAHRLTTTVNADNIVVLREGRIAEQGSHAALFAADGMYRRIWEHQFPLSDVTGAKNRISPHAAPISYIRAT
jgi:ATP-binding cassette subfamily B protein